MKQRSGDGLPDMDGGDITGAAQDCRGAHTDRSLAIACTRGREAVISRFTHLLAEESFTEQQWRVMRILFDFEPIPLTMLCHRTCIHKVSMTRIVRTLQEKKFVERRRRESNARAFDVFLTDLGRETMARMTPAANEIYRGITADFGEKDTRELLRLLNKLSTINEK